jgi:hypothetical protein
MLCLLEKDTVSADAFQGPNMASAHKAIERPLIRKQQI